jgi:serine protease
MNRLHVRWLVTLISVVAGLAVALLPSVAGAQAVAGVSGSGMVSRPWNPYSPSYRHPYRYGAVPTRAALARMDAYRAQHPAVAGSAAAPAGLLEFGGGSSGIGVVTGQPKVYLVFWGSAWGISGSDSHGDLTLSGDPFGGAPVLQRMFRGLGTGGERWSAVMTQYCEGVPAGATACPAASPHVPYPSGGVLAGVFYDPAVVPVTATADQVATEAASAARWFGNTTAAANRNAQYLILSPTGFHPDGFGTAPFCAWHGVASLSGVPIPFTNLPYVMDLGTQCGMGLVNGPGPGGALDGYTSTAGHEYAETLTDPLPLTGWRDPALGHDGETADKCVPGILASLDKQPVNVTTATGTFVLPATWSNDTSGCETSHVILPIQTAVPNLIGLSQTGATAALTSAGLRLGLVSKVVDCNNQGIVLGQNPSAGTTVLASSAVNITVGSRPAPPRVCP